MTHDAPRLYTKAGDDGETGLLYGGRISKADPRAEAYGAIDEAVSALGLARALAADPLVRENVELLQRDLFTVAAELATAADQRERLAAHFGVVTPEMTQRLEVLIDRLQAETELPRAFVVPGDSPASGALDLARAIVRRAERRVVALRQAGLLHGPEVLRFLNRAGDLLFILARYHDRRLPYNRV